jgi:hypothetical protein
MPMHFAMPEQGLKKAGLYSLITSDAEPMPPWVRHRDISAADES